MNCFLRAGDIYWNCFYRAGGFIEKALMDDETNLVFKLADLAQLHTSSMEQLGVEHDGKVHTTSLKQRLFAPFPNMYKASGA